MKSFEAKIFGYYFINIIVKIKYKFQQLMMTNQLKYQLLYMHKTDVMSFICNYLLTVTTCTSYNKNNFTS